MRAAFKEWAIVVDALQTGEQILILRKGGISEGPGGFKVEHPSFWLFPTFFHQQRESVVEKAQARFDLISQSFPPAEAVRLRSFAQVVSAHHLQSLAQAHRLKGQHIWREEVIAERFDWGHSKGIFALALRVFVLPQPIEVPMLKSYGGCKSWVDLSVRLSDAGAAPALSSEAFANRLHQLHSSLDGSLAVP